MVNLCFILLDPSSSVDEYVQAFFSFWSSLSLGDFLTLIEDVEPIAQTGSLRRHSRAVLLCNTSQRPLNSSTNTKELCRLRNGKSARKETKVTKVVYHPRLSPVADHGLKTFNMQ